MVTTYTTVNKVEQYLGIAAGTFTASTNPTSETVEWIINVKEDKMDAAMGTSYRERAVYEETHDFPKGYNAYRYGTGVPIYLNFRPVLSFSTAKGDKIEVYDGQNWTDWVASKTEGRNNDFWVDYQRGVIWMRTYFPFTRDSLVRITYRYGNVFITTLDGDINTTATVARVFSVKGAQVKGWIRIDNEEMTYSSLTHPVTIPNITRGAYNTTAVPHSSGAEVIQFSKDIEDICTKMACLELLENNDLTGVIPSNADAWRAAEKVTEWKQEIDEWLSRHKRIRFVAR